ncbi:MAG: AI-2E family transporter, partial [Algoriphagus sp.]|nr:AI-2E family transporter [Algoriphagus sp.]
GPQGSSICTGSLVNGFQLLTAAHCLADDNGNLVATSARAVFFTDTGTYVGASSSFEIHPDYTGSVFDDHDIAIMNLIPYVGVFISSLFAILYVFLTTDTLFYPILTFATLWGIQLFENNIITPLVVGSKVKVNALAVIFAILIGGWLWGVSGMVLFIPLIGVLKITLERNEDLKPFGYLLSDDVPVSEVSENFWKLLQRKISSGKIDKQ